MLEAHFSSHFQKCFSQSKRDSVWLWRALSCSCQLSLPAAYLIKNNSFRKKKEKSIPCISFHIIFIFNLFQRGGRAFWILYYPVNVDNKKSWSEYLESSSLKTCDQNKNLGVTAAFFFLNQRLSFTNGFSKPHACLLLRAGFITTVLYLWLFQTKQTIDYNSATHVSTGQNREIPCCFQTTIQSAHFG